MLFAYERWATRRVLAVLDGLDSAVWARTGVVDERGLGGLLDRTSARHSGGRTEG